MPYDTYMVNLQLTKGLQPAFESIIMRPVNAQRDAAMSTKQVFDTSKSGVETSLEALAAIEASAENIAGSCNSLLSRHSERERIYAAAQRPLRKHLSKAELVKQARAELAQQ